ncbi:hypothetical protein D3C85_1931420 [compost metagenome]
MRPQTLGRFLALAAFAVVSFTFGVTTGGLFMENAPDMPRYVPFITLAISVASGVGMLKVAKDLIYK